MSTDNQNKADMAQLLDLPAFRRMLWRIINESGMMRSAYGTDGRDLAYREGRRSLGLDILRWADSGQPLPRDDALSTWLAALSEEERTSPPPKGKPRDRRSDPLRIDDSDDDGA